MAVLTEAIEAERGAGAAKVIAVDLDVNDMAMTTDLAVTITAEVGGPALDLDPLMTTAITALRVVPVEMREMMIDALAVSETLADVAPVAKGPRSSTRMSAIDAPFLYSSLRRV